MTIKDYFNSLSSHKPINDMPFGKTIQYETITVLADGSKLFIVFSINKCYNLTIFFSCSGCEYDYEFIFDLFNKSCIAYKIHGDLQDRFKLELINKDIAYLLNKAILAYKSLRGL